MKQVLQDRSGATVVRSVPSPPCPAGGVLVRNEFSVISTGTERARLELSRKSLVGKALERPDLVRQVLKRAQTEGLRSTSSAVRRQLKTETAVGYSSAGTVIEVGRRVPGLNVGDRVACCGGGHANHAEVVAMPRNMVARVPEAVPMASAAMTTIAAIALHGIRLGAVEVGQRVAVIGCGLVGQLACRLLTASGAEVFALDVEQSRIDQATAAGADHGLVSSQSVAEQIRNLTGGLGVDVVFVTAAATTNSPLLTATAIARDRGAVVLIGAVPVDLPRTELYEKELLLRVSRSYGPGRYDREFEERGLDYPIAYVRWTEQRNMEAVLDLQARSRLTLVDLIEEVIPVDEAARAYSLIEAPTAQRPVGAIVLSYPAESAAAAMITPPVPAAPTRVAKGGTVRVGLIGPGSFASRVLVPAFIAAGAGLEIVGGGSGQSAEAARRELGFSRVAENEDGVIFDEAVDAVVIGTRHGTHASLAERALDAGKNVFCEKPLALSEDELGSVLAAAGSAAGQLMVGFNRRYSPLMTTLRDFLTKQPLPLTAAYRVSAGRIDKNSWVHDLEQGGGRAIGEACHFVDTLRFLVGSPITGVHAFGYGQPDAPAQARDNLVISLSFADGSASTIIYSAAGSSQLPKERLEVFQGGRTAVLDDYRALELYGPDGRQTIKTRNQEKGHREEVASFIAGIRTGTVRMPLPEIANVSLASIAIVESMVTGQAVTL